MDPAPLMDGNPIGLHDARITPHLATWSPYCVGRLEYPDFTPDKPRSLFHGELCPAHESELFISKEKRRKNGSRNNKICVDMMGKPHKDMVKIFAAAKILDYPSKNEK
ncbi:hypothetical protein PV325_010380, partial [Microctonus aethiopoides]